jgi:hypothetical protein
LRKLLVAPLFVAVLVACGVPGRQMATVTMDTAKCAVDAVGLHSGTVDFTVRNQNGRTIKFSVTENENEAVASVNVAPGAIGTLSVKVDEDDLYHTQCGDVVGPDLVIH